MRGRDEWREVITNFVGLIPATRLSPISSSASIQDGIHPRCCFSLLDTGRGHAHDRSCRLEMVDGDSLFRDDCIAFKLPLPLRPATHWTIKDVEAHTMRLREVTDEGCTVPLVWTWPLASSPRIHTHPIQAAVGHGSIHTQLLLVTTRYTPYSPPSCRLLRSRLDTCSPFSQDAAGRGPIHTHLRPSCCFFRLDTYPLPSPALKCCW